MTHRYPMGASLTLVAWILGSGQVAAQQYPPAFPDDGATMARENDLVAIWDVTREPGTTSAVAMHELTMDQVSVTLAEGAVKITRPDETWTVEHERFGFVRFESQGTIRSVEALGIPSRVVVFQLKSAELPRWPEQEGVPGQFPRVGATKLFETARIRVWDQTWTPGVRIARHSHYVPTAAVFLEGGMLRTFDEGRPNAPFRRTRGDVLGGASPLAAPHAEEQVEGRPRAIWIEFK